MRIRFDARPESVELDPQHAALVIVDMQNAFTAQGGVFDKAGLDVSPAAQVITVIRRLVEPARRAGVKIVYLQMGYREDLSDSGGPDSPNWQKELALVLMRKLPEFQEKPLIAGTWDFAIVDELKPRPGDLVVVKTRYSGFAGTQLDSLLRSRNIRFLFFAGIATNVCVESTLRDAFFLEYWPLLIKDATMQAGPAFLKDATIHNVENHFGWTLTSEEFLKPLA